MRVYRTLQLNTFYISSKRIVDGNRVDERNIKQPRVLFPGGVRRRRVFKSRLWLKWRRNLLHWSASDCQWSFKGKGEKKWRPESEPVSVAAKENWNELVSSSISRTTSCLSIIFLIFEPVRIRGSSAYRYVVGFTRDFGPSMTHCTYRMYVPEPRLTSRRGSAATIRVKGTIETSKGVYSR